MLNIDRIATHALQTEPFRWAMVDQLFAHADAAALADTFPRDHFKKVMGYDGEKGYEYAARSLVHMGATQPSFADALSDSWRRLAEDLLSAEYRAALTRLTGTDLTRAPMEINVVHYGAGAWLGPHLDLREKIVTQVFYFNTSWNVDDGGCLNILRSSTPTDIAATIAPIVGNSVVLVRSDKSWHTVSRVASHCRGSRRSMNVIFHLPGSISTMWPPGVNADLGPYRGED
jgi:Rps23 Pro-64 3,4-dihydroxylase Tpa1-like proline 4-hydroxylase